MERRHFWDRYLRVYDSLNQLGDYRACMRDVADGLALRPGQTVLDAGSGTGNLSVLLRALGAAVTSMDFSPVALALHREKDPEARLVEASLEKPLPFSDRRFDHLTCLSVLFAISPEGSRLALREFRRVLKPGGTLVVTAMMPGHSKVRALVQHVASRARELGLRGFLSEAGATLVPLLRVLYYNLRMYGFRRQGGYRRFGRPELLAEIRGAGFVGLRYRTTYGGRFHMVVARCPDARALRGAWNADAGGSRGALSAGACPAPSWA
ncbi:MAG TPA: methyltransferase domain-containing protein [Planctomycetota bacterium]|nr:methyltransferase domain-containing protein [Planctomycetota bacterium]